MPGRVAARPLFRMLRYVVPHRRLVAASTVLRLANLSLGVLILGYAGYLVSRAVITGAGPQAGDWIMLVGIGIGKALSRYAEQVSGHVAAFRILDTLRAELFRGFSSKSIAVRSSARSGDIVSRAMADVELVEVYYAHTLAPVAAAGVFIVAASIVVGIAIGVGAGFATLVLLLAAGMGVPAAAQQVSVRVGRQSRERAGDLSGDISESLAGIQDIVATGARDRFAARIRCAGSRYAASTAKLMRYGAAKDAVVDALLIGSLLTVVGAGLSVYSGASATAVWGVACGLTGGFGALLGVSRAVDDLPKSAAAASRILQLVDEPPTSTTVGRKDAPAHGREQSPSTPAVAFESVSFAHWTGGGVHGVTFHVPPGSHIFVAGPSGSGKSTLASLLLRLMHPQAGSIALHGIPIALFTDTRLRALVSAAPQDPGLVRGTVAENVALGLCPGQGNQDNADATALLEDARRIADLDSLYRQLPDADLTLVGGADEQLSGGQKKRIALARLVARNPRITVLDEAFSGLDARLQRAIRGRFLEWARSGDRTVIEFSHDLAHAADAHQVLVMDQGRLVQQGTYGELVAAPGLFSQLLEAQADEI